MIDKKAIVQALSERTQNYESTDKDYFITQLLELIDPVTLRLIAREQGIDIDKLPLTF